MVRSVTGRRRMMAPWAMARRTTVRTCHTDGRYAGAAGLVNTYRQGPNLVSGNQARVDCQVDDADLWVVESALEQDAFDGDWTGITDLGNENV